MCATLAAPIWIAPDALFDGQRLRQGMALAVTGARTGDLRARAGRCAAAWHRLERDPACHSPDRDQLTALQGLRVAFARSKNVLNCA